MKGGIRMLSKCYYYPDGGLDALKPDAYDAEGNLTINSWELYKQDELASEDEN